MLSHISYSLYWRMEMGNDTVMLNTAPVAAVPQTARQSLTKPRSCWNLQPRAGRDAKGKTSEEQPR